MPKITCARFVRVCAVRIVVLAVVLLPTHGAFAATDWSAIQAAMGTDGYVFPRDVLHFQLSRHDLAISVDGVPLQQPVLSHTLLTWQWRMDLSPSSKSALMTFSSTALFLPRIRGFGA